MFQLVEKEDNLFLGEGSVFYFPSKHVAERLIQIMPDVKLIFVLRDPVIRTWSHYNFVNNPGKTTMKFENQVIDEVLNVLSIIHDGNTPVTADELRANPDLLLDTTNMLNIEKFDFWKFIDERQRKECIFFYHNNIMALSMYYYQLIQFYDQFPKNQIMLIDGNDLDKNTTNVLEKVFDYLNVPPFPIQNMKKQNESPNKVPMSNLTRTLLENVFIPFDVELKKYLNKSFSWMN